MTVHPTVELVSDPCQLADETLAQEVARLLAKARIEGAREERGRIIAAVEAERRRWLGKYGPYRDAHVDATLLLLDVLGDLPMAGVSDLERNNSALDATITASAQE